MLPSRSSDLARRAELRHFLRARRAAISPSEVGLPPGERRRTPGLRREEVAQLAGIGTTWYTFLEQGRSVRVSVKVVDRLAAALGLNGEERKHLYQLALGVPQDEAASAQILIPAELRAILDTLNPHPAYILDHRFDMIAMNRAGSLVFDYSEAMPAQDRNVIRRLILDPKKRWLHRDYEQHLRNTIAAFRAHFWRHAGDQRMKDLVAELERESPEFRRLWSQHEILERERLQMTLHLDHPTLGDLAGRFTFLSVFGCPELTICVFTLEPGTKGATNVRRAVRAPAFRR